jgi:hypothetical protein
MLQRTTTYHPSAPSDDIEFIDAVSVKAYPGDVKHVGQQTCDNDTKDDNADNDTKDDNADKDTKHDNADKDTKHDNADKDTKDDNADKDTKDDNADKDTKHDNADKDTKDDNADKDTKHDNADKDTKNDDADDDTKDEGYIHQGKRKERTAHIMLGKMHMHDEMYTYDPHDINGDVAQPGYDVSIELRTYQLAVMENMRLLAEIYNNMLYDTNDEQLRHNSKIYAWHVCHARRLRGKIEELHANEDNSKKRRVESHD